MSFLSGYGVARIRAGRSAFVCNIMDRETRYLIVSKLTKDRAATDTTAAFEEVSVNAHGIKSETVFTDSLRHYNIALRVRSLMQSV
jgi:hypothetical protein